MLHAPEIQKLRSETFGRMAAFGMLSLLAGLTALARVGITPINLRGPLGTLVVVLAMAAVIYLGTNRDTWLPFLGETVFPPGVLVPKVPADASYTVTLREVPRGAVYVVYWASETAPSVVPNPADAYQAYKNSGVAEVSPADRTAVLQVRCPGRYKVNGKTLPRHIHWRAIFPSGISGPIETLNVTCL